MTLLTNEARADIQGLITSAYGHLPDAAFLFLTFGDRRLTREWLHRLADEITTAVSWRASPSDPKRKPVTAVNVAISFAGFRALGLPERALGSFSREFQFGMPARAEILGDVDESAPSQWEFGSSPERLHAVLMLHGADPPTLSALVERCERDIGACGGSILAREGGHRFSTGQELFGFSDGVSQPEIERVVKGPSAGQTLSPTGEFILGYPTTYGPAPPSVGVPAEDDRGQLLPPFPEQPRWRDFGRHGAYMVFRKLEQDVAGFWRFMQHNVEQGPAPAAPSEKEAAMLGLAAKFVGRWRSGAPLTLAPERDDPALGADSDRNNDFSFMPSDAYGFSCPFGSHIRRMNPRDSLTTDPPAEAVKTSNRHRLMRRGIPYGDWLLKDTVVDVHDDGGRRGLHFIAIAAELKRQFEFVQSQWLNNPNFDGLFADKDPLVGSNEGGGQMTLQHTLVRRTIQGVPSFVTTRGGGYFFLPSVTALRFLADG